MDISINDLIRYSLDVVTSKLEDGAIDNLFGNSLNHPDKKEVSFSESDFRAFEKLLIEDAVISLYKVIVSNPIALAVAMSKNSMTRPESVKGYVDNILKLNGELRNFEREMDSAVKNKVDTNYIVFNDPENRKSYKQFLAFMDSIVPFFQIALKAEKVCLDKNIGDAEFLKIVTDYNRKINEILEHSKSKIENFFVVGPAFDQVFEQFTENFKRNAKTVQEYKVMIDDIEAHKKAVISERPRQSMPKAEMSEKEKSRLQKIQEANELYERFQLDFMRDLQKEVSLMNRDMYNALIDKVEVFLKRFPMPLSNNVSLGMATEAYAQITKFIDTVYYISRNTYTPVILGE